MRVGSLTGSLSLVSGPAEEPVTLAEVKQHCRVDYDDDDALLSTLISAATERVERELNRDLMQRTWDFVFDEFPCDAYDDAFLLPRNPVQSVTSITYTDEAGNTGQTVATSVYGVNVNDEPAVVYLQDEQDWPDVLDQRESVTVRFVTGYAGTGDSPVSRANVPNAIRIAIMMLVADMYQNRMAQVTRSVGLDENPAVQALLRPYRIHWL